MDTVVEESKWGGVVTADPIGHITLEEGSMVLDMTVGNLVSQNGSHHEGIEDLYYSIDQNPLNTFSIDNSTGELTLNRIAEQGDTSYDETASPEATPSKMLIVRVEDASTADGTSGSGSESHIRHAHVEVLGTLLELPISTVSEWTDPSIPESWIYLGNKYENFTGGGVQWKYWFSPSTRGIWYKLETNGPYTLTREGTYAYSFKHYEAGDEEGTEVIHTNAHKFWWLDNETYTRYNVQSDTNTDYNIIAVWEQSSTTAAQNANLVKVYLARKDQ